MDFGDVCLPLAMDKRFFSKNKNISSEHMLSLSNEAVLVVYQLKSDFELSVICAVDKTAPFQVESDASEFALAATLSQKSRAVAFFQGLRVELNKITAVEKEAAAIIEAVDK